MQPYARDAENGTLKLNIIVACEMAPLRPKRWVSPHTGQVEQGFNNFLFVIGFY